MGETHRSPAPQDTELAARLRQLRAGAHRLAQPLTAITGFTEVLEARCAADDPEVAELFRLLRDAIEELSRELDQLRALTQEPGGTAE